MKPSARPEISIVIPAHNEAASIGDIVRRSGRVMDSCERSYEVLVIDDGSEDNTGEIARSAGAKVIRHPYGIGNGAAVKTGIRNARGDIVVTLDGDGQHAPEDIPFLLEKMNAFDMAVGARNRHSATSLHRDFANAVYNRFATYVCKRKIDDLTSGFRAIKTVIAREFVSLLPNTFSYPTTLTLAVVRSGYSLVYVPVTTVRRSGKSKIRLFKDGVRFFLILLKIATLFSPMRVFLPVSFFMFALGLGYGLFRIFTLDGRYGPTSAMLMTMSLVVFMVGLVSEQVAQLRHERTDRQSSAQQHEGNGKGTTHES